jgi:transposase
MPLPADAPAGLVLDGAGWHDARARAVPDNLTLVPLPAHSPELNPVERVWLYLRPAPALPVAAPLPRYRGHYRGLLPSLERPRRKNRPPSIALPLSLDHKARFIDSPVLGTVLEST